MKTPALSKPVKRGLLALPVLLALSAGGHQQTRQGPLDWLRENHSDWPGYESSPAALGQLVLTAHAAGADPTDFGGTNLVELLNALGPAPERTDRSATSGPDSETSADGDDAGFPSALLWVLGVGLIAGIAFGALLSTRRKKGAESDQDRSTERDDPSETADSAETGEGTETGQGTETGETGRATETGEQGETGRNS
jgi:hypothetical protein